LERVEGENFLESRWWWNACKDSLWRSSM